MRRPWLPWLLIIALVGLGEGRHARADEREAHWEERLEESREQLSPPPPITPDESREGADRRRPAVEPTGEVAIGEVTLQAQRLSLREDGTYQAVGRVVLRYRTTTVTANTVTFDQNTGEIWAPGKVSVEQDGAVLETEDVYLNFYTELGMLGPTEARVEAKDYYVAAEELKKTGHSTFSVRNGRFTACKPPRPTWEFHSDRMKVDLEGKVTARNVLFYWQGIPILYLPYFEQNIADERASGLLLSKPETSSRYGLAVDNTYFWVINDSMDATFFFDIKGVEGFGVGGEFRYALGPKSAGEFRAYRLEDDSGVSHELKGELSHHISDRTRAHLDFHYIDETDDDTLRGFTSSSATRVSRNLVSDAFVSQRYPSVVGTVNLRLFQDLVDREEDEYHRLPEMKVEMPLTPVWNNRAFVLGEFSLTNFWRDQGSHGWRVDLQNGLRKDFHPIDGIDLYGQLGLEGTLYTFSQLEQNRNQRDRALAEARLGVSGQLHRRYGAFDHVLEPQAEYIARGGDSSDDLPQIDRLDQRGRAHQIALLLTQRIKERRNGQDRLILRTGAAVNLRDAAPSVGDDSLDAFAELAYRPLQGASLDLETHWDTDTGDHQESGLDLSLLKSGKWFLRTGMRWVDDDRYFITAAYGLRFSPRWSVAAEQWFDADRGDLSEASLIVDRTGLCYGISLELRYFRTADEGLMETSDEYRVLGKLRLLNVGSVETPSLSIERESTQRPTHSRRTEPSEEEREDGDSLDPTRLIRNVLRGSFL